MQIDLRVSTAAANYIRRSLLRDNGSVAVIVPELIQAPGTGVSHLDEEASIDALIQHGMRHFDSLPAHVSVRWTIAAAERARFPSADIHVVDGIEFYLPEETSSALGVCELVVRDGTLRFDPEPPAFEVKRVAR